MWKLLALLSWNGVKLGTEELLMMRIEGRRDFRLREPQGVNFWQLVVGNGSCLMLCFGHSCVLVGLLGRLNLMQGIIGAGIRGLFEKVIVIL